MRERESIGASSRTNLCREWSSCSRDGRRGRIHVGSWPEAAGSSSWPGTTSTDLRQPSFGWPDVRPNASNGVLVTVVTQGAVGLEKSRAVAGERRRRAGWVAAAVGRMHALWICLARSRIWTACVTMFNETTVVPLTALCSNWNFMGTIVNIGGKFWAARAWFACYRWRVGQCHGRQWLVNPHCLCWELGPARGRAAVIFLIRLLTLTRGPVTIFFQMKHASLKY
jgi:hypothetical protein